jgi:hypothetical protein
MKKMRLMFLALIVAMAGTTSAYAHDSYSFSFSVGAPVYYAAPPVVYYPAAPVVYYSPAPMYYGFYGAPSVYYRSYAPRPYYYNRGNYGGWNHGGHR